MKPRLEPTFDYNITLNDKVSLQYQNGTKESKMFQAQYQEIIIMS